MLFFFSRVSLDDYTLKNDLFTSLPKTQNPKKWNHFGPADCYEFIFHKYFVLRVCDHSEW